MEEKENDGRSPRISAKNDDEHFGISRNVITRNFTIRFLRRISILVVAGGLGVVMMARPLYALDEADKRAQTLAHYTMGLVLDWQGESEKAIEEYQKAVTLDDKNYAIHLRLGADYGRLNQFDKAVVELEAAVRLKPDDVQAHYLLALIYSSQAKTEKATNEYEIILQKVIQESPQSVDGYAFLGQLYYSQGKIAEAVEQFEKAVAIDPKDAAILSILGSLYLEVPDKAKAAESFERSLILDPDQDGSLNSLGYMYAEDGQNLDEAQKLVSRALELDPENGAYLDSMGWVFYKKGDYAKALSFLERAMKFVEDPVVYDHVGDVYFKLNKPVLALQYWEKSLAMDPLQDEVRKKVDAHKALVPSRN